MHIGPPKLQALGLELVALSLAADLGDSSTALAAAAEAGGTVPAPAPSDTADATAVHLRAAVAAALHAADAAVAGATRGFPGRTCREQSSRQVVRWANGRQAGWMAKGRPMVQKEGE